MDFISELPNGQPNGFKWTPLDSSIGVLVYQGRQGDWEKRLHWYCTIGEQFPICFSSCFSIFVLSDTIVSYAELDLFVSSLL